MADKKQGKKFQKKIGKKEKLSQRKEEKKERLQFSFYAYYIRTKVYILNTTKEKNLQNEKAQS